MPDQNRRWKLNVTVEAPPTSRRTRHPRRLRSIAWWLAGAIGSGLIGWCIARALG